MAFWRRSRYRSQRWDWYPKSRPKEVVGGLRLRSARGEVASTWWGKRWTEVLDSFGWHTRLERGRRYARQGQVASVKIEPGQVLADVQGSRPKPYRVKISLHAYPPKDWARAAEALSGRALFAAKLLAGEMPSEIDEALRKAHAPLFPRAKSDLSTDCNCPDWENPCKHVAAVYYILAQEFDRDPFLLFKIRGISREDFLARIRAGRGDREDAAGDPDEMRPAFEPVPAAKPAAAKAGAGTSLSRTGLDRFFQAPKPLPEIPALGPDALERLPQAGGRLREMGVPPFWSGERDFQQSLALCYREARRRVLGRAYSGSANLRS